MAVLIQYKSPNNHPTKKMQEWFRWRLMKKLVYCFEQTKPQPSRLIIVLLLLEKEVSLPGLCSQQSDLTHCLSLVFCLIVSKLVFQSSVSSLYVQVANLSTYLKTSLKYKNIFNILFTLESVFSELIWHILQQK